MPLDDIDDEIEALRKSQAANDKQLGIHEAVCAERYGKIVDGLDEMKSIVAEQGKALASITAKLMERAGSGRAVREVIAYVIALASIIAALYSGGLVHVGR